ncbi:MAG: BltR family transcriptional regulator, partial [Eubacteriales bacterium]|nr:BltR family transcriptional regulator [Eubacteriales bacterium]
RMSHICPYLELSISRQPLLEAKTFLQQKQDKLELGLSAFHGKIEQISLPEQRIILSEPITGAYDENDFSVATSFSLRLKKLFGLYDNFGSRISVANILHGNFSSYDAFFAYGRDEIAQYDVLLPAGEYLRAFCIGGWERLQDVYQMVLSFADKHGLTLTGYAYEEGLNEMSLQKSDDYITMITIAYTLSS